MAVPDTAPAKADKGTATPADADRVLWDAAMGPDAGDAEKLAGAPKGADVGEDTAVPKTDFVLDESLGDPDVDADTGDEEDADSDADGEPGEKVTAKAAAQDADPVVFTVEEGGTTREIRRSEAHRGYLRQADYTRKTTAVADTRKEAESARDAHLAMVEAYQKHLAAVREPNFEKIREEGGTEAYLLAKEEWRAIEQERAAADAEQAKLTQEGQRDESRRQAEAVQQAAEQVKAALPAWKDAKVAGREVAAIRAYLTSKGFSAEEVAQVYDPRLVLVLREAALYHQMREKTKGKVRPASRTLKPGTVVSTTTQTARGVKAARQKLRETGDPTDYFEATGLLD